MAKQPLVLVCLAALAAGCGALEGGEFDRQQCGDELDNDRDGLADCADPDCQVFELCRSGVAAAGAGASGDAAVGTAWTGDAPAAPGGEREDRQPPAPAGSPSAEEPASGSEPDASQEPPASMPGAEPEACDASTSECTPSPPGCTGAECQPVEPAPATWRITTLEAEVPKQTTYTRNNEQDCVDPDSQCAVPLRLPPFVLCGCSPDPWIRVLVDDREVGRTAAKLNTTSPDWRPDLALALDTASQVRFEVMDRDLTDDHLIYGCSVPVNGDLLAAGNLACAESFMTDTGSRAFSVRARVEPLAQ